MIDLDLIIDVASEQIGFDVWGAVGFQDQLKQSKSDQFGLGVTSHNDPRAIKQIIGVGVVGSHKRERVLTKSSAKTSRNHPF
ncbi:hypothetical protein FCV25MIE_28979 [Fagus crenata]